MPSLQKENDWLFKEYVVPLAGARGAYVAFVSNFGKSNRVYMENVSIEAVTCARPFNVTVGDIYSDGATLSWIPQGSASSWIVNVALNADTASVFRRDTVYATEYRITDLPCPTRLIMWRCSPTAEKAMRATRQPSSLSAQPTCPCGRKRSRSAPTSRKAGCSTMKRLPPIRCGWLT